MKKASHQEALEELTQTHTKGADVRPYELTAISTNLTDTEITDFIERVKKILTNHNAEVQSEAAPMRARLAYPIKKTQQGVYFFIRFAAIPAKIKDITHDLQLMPEMLRPHIDGLISFTNTKTATAPVATIATTKSVPRGWTKRDPSTGSWQETEAIAPSTTNGVASPKPEKTAEEKVTIEDLDKRLDEILGKNS